MSLLCLRHQHHHPFHVSILPADPILTAIGEGQATVAHDMWKQEQEFKIPLPQKLYCSPMTRAIQTLNITYDGITDASCKPVILEVRRLYGIALNDISTSNRRIAEKNMECILATSAVTSLTYARTFRTSFLRKDLRRRMSCGPKILGRRRNTFGSVRGRFLTRYLIKIKMRLVSSGDHDIFLPRR